MPVSLKENCWIRELCKSLIIITKVLKATMKISMRSCRCGILITGISVNRLFSMHFPKKNRQKLQVRCHYLTILMFRILMKIFCKKQNLHKKRLQTSLQMRMKVRLLSVLKFLVKSIILRLMKTLLRIF